MFVISHRNFFFILSGILSMLAIVFVFVYGLTFSIDFTGGSLLEVTYMEARPGKAILEEQLSNLSIGGFSLRETGETGYLLRTRDLTEPERIAALEIFSNQGAIQAGEERFTSIGPTVGAELRNKALMAISLTILAIILYIAFAFRHVSEPISSWKYGIIAVLTLVHDLLIPLGLFALLGSLFAAEIDTLFVVAMLTILGYSVNDKIVVFDRVRENLRLNKELNRRENFDLTVGKSLNQTYGRSINTSLTTVLALLALFFLGPETTQNFSLVLLVGVIAGAYSSIFLAAPFLTVINNLQGKKARA
jgi:preprotein translocase subunit SecF